MSASGHAPRRPEEGTEDTDRLYREEGRLSRRRDEGKMEGKENGENIKRFRDTPEEDVQPSADSGGRCGCRTGTEEWKKVSERGVKINE